MRRNELACRDQWSRSLWEEGAFETGDAASRRSGALAPLSPGEFARFVDRDAPDARDGDKEAQDVVLGEARLVGDATPPWRRTTLDDIPVEAPPFSPGADVRGSGGAFARLPRPGRSIPDLRHGDLPFSPEASAAPAAETEDREVPARPGAEAPRDAAPRQDDGLDADPAALEVSIEEAVAIDLGDEIWNELAEGVGVAGGSHAASMEDDLAESSGAPGVPIVGTALDAAADELETGIWRASIGLTARRDRSGAAPRENRDWEFGARNSIGSVPSLAPAGSPVSGAHRADPPGAVAVDEAGDGPPAGGRFGWRRRRGAAGDLYRSAPPDDDDGLARGDGAAAAEGHLRGGSQQDPLVRPRTEGGNTPDGRQSGDLAADGLFAQGGEEPDRPGGGWAPEPVSVAPALPRICRTCRDFRAGETGGSGWCANAWAFPHRQVVTADAPPACDGAVGSWWLPTDELRVERVDVSAHALETPLLDRWLPGQKVTERQRRPS